MGLLQGQGLELSQPGARAPVSDPHVEACLAQAYAPSLLDEKKKPISVVGLLQLVPNIFWSNESKSKFVPWKAICGYFAIRNQNLS